MKSAAGDDGGRYVSVVLLNGWGSHRESGGGSGGKNNDVLFLEEESGLRERLGAWVLVRWHQHRLDVASVSNRCSGDYCYTEIQTD